MPVPGLGTVPGGVGVDGPAPGWPGFVIPVLGVVRGCKGSVIPVLGTVNVCVDGAPGLALPRSCGAGGTVRSPGAGGSPPDGVPVGGTESLGDDPAGGTPSPGGAGGVVAGAGGVDGDDVTPPPAVCACAAPLPASAMAAAAATMSALVIMMLILPGGDGLRPDEKGATRVPVSAYCGRERR